MPTITLKHSANCLWKGKLRLWLELLCFAERYGWKPAGGRKPRGDGPEWDGDYELPLGQIVSENDARAFANALRHGLQGTSLLFTSDARATVRKVINFCQQVNLRLWLPRAAEGQIASTDSNKRKRLRNALARRPFTGFETTPMRHSTPKAKTFS